LPREIVVNGRFLSRRVTGVERYGREILRLFPGDHRLVTTRAHGAAGHAWEQFIFPIRLSRDTIVWSPANSGPLIVRNQALTIHDLSPLEHPEWFTRGYSAWYRLFLPTLARRVRIIFTPSNHVKKKVLARFDAGRVLVTPNGVDSSVFHPGAAPPRLELPEKYILFVGSLQPRKNLAGLMQAWGKLEQEFKKTWLIVAGSTGSVFHEVNLSSNERVRFLGTVDEDNLPGLYAGAELFVLPSLDEGFGLPALEAMACGTPVIASNGGALPETVGEAGLIFDSSRPDTLTHIMQTCLHDKNLRVSLIEKGLVRAKQFSWQTTADLIWNTLNEL
jgi:glycosyltransferase involved in cell wall biosynthesis